MFDGGEFLGENVYAVLIALAVLFLQLLLLGVSAQQHRVLTSDLSAVVLQLFFFLLEFRTLGLILLGDFPLHVNLLMQLGDHVVHRASAVISFVKYGFVGLLHSG